MKTLYLRNVPDDVSERLAVLAAREGLSVSALAVRELAAATRRADNPALLGVLPDLGLAPADVVADLEAGRARR
jgi:plasmid stability protein